MIRQQAGYCDKCVILPLTPAFAVPTEDLVENVSVNNIIRQGDKV